jgi:hypothetical protein
MADTISLIETIAVPTMRISLRSDQIIQIVPDDGIHITLENVKLQIAAVGQLAGGKKYPVLVYSGVGTNIDTETMNYVATEKSNPFALAEAYLISNISHKLLASFYLKINRPFRPTRAFTAEQAAVSWLQSFLPANPKG